MQEKVHSKQSVKNKRSILSLSTSESTLKTQTTIDSVPRSNENKTANKMLNLESFKAFPCELKIKHNQKSCPFFHNDKDKRKIPINYSEDLCHESCDKNSCQKSHNRVEQLYHPSNYKRKFCSYFPNKLQNCEYKEFCSFAHSEDEIQIVPLHNFEYDEDFFMFHYKTEWCPMNLTQHEKSKCVYAHNLQDFRRKVHILKYSPDPCENWNFKSFVTRNNEHCKLGNSCPKSHGWKESEFHPMNYLTRQCLSKGICPRARECPFFHTAIDKRIIPDDVKNGIFELMPRNRIVENTFKYLMPEEDDSNRFERRMMRKTVPEESHFITKCDNRRASESVLKASRDYEESFRKETQEVSEHIEEESEEELE